jgi:chemotaxis protein methyltransferase CheR
VAIYFSDEFKEDLFKKINGTLNPGGLLFIGSSESLNRHSTDYHLQEYGKCLYYQTKGGGNENLICR